MRTRRNQRTSGLACGLVATLTAVFCLANSGAEAQQQPSGIPKAEAGPQLQPLPKPKAKPKSRPVKRARGGLGIGGAPVAAIRKEVENQNAQERPNLERRRDTQYYKVTIARADNTYMALNYYPALPGENPSVVVLIHEKDRTSRDFADKIEESKDGYGLAAALQADGFAVVSIDVAGLTDPRRRDAAAKNDVPKAKPAATDGRVVEQAVNDIRLTYQFLVDRHNRLEFNLGKLAIVTLGEGADVALEWLREATEPPPVVPGRPVQPNDPRLKNAGAKIAGGAFDSATDRPSDVSALIMVSPVAAWQNVKTVDRLKTLLEGSPLNVMAVGGTTDKESSDVLKQIKPIIERGSSRLSKVESIETGLHGARLLRFEPGILDRLTRFLEQTVEFQKNEWEPRYNLTPVAYRVMDAVSKTTAQAEARKASDAEKTAPKPKAEEPAKPKTDAPKAKTEPVPEPKADAPKPATDKPAEPKAEAPKAEQPKSD